MKRNSWHWRLASFYGPLHDQGSDVDQHYNICPYTWAVVGGMWNVFLIMVGAFMCALGIGDTMAWMAASLVEGTFINMDMPAQVTLLVIGAVVGMVLVYVVHENINDYREHRRQKLYDAMHKKSHFHTICTNPKEPGFISVWYKNFKEKTCVSITIEKEATHDEQ